MNSSSSSPAASPLLVPNRASTRTPPGHSPSSPKEVAAAPSTERTTAALQGLTLRDSEVSPLSLAPRAAGLRAIGLIKPATKGVASSTTADVNTPPAIRLAQEHGRISSAEYLATVEFAQHVGDNEKIYAALKKGFDTGGLPQGGERRTLLAHTARFFMSPAPSCVMDIVDPLRPKLTQMVLSDEQDGSPPNQQKVNSVLGRYQEDSYFLLTIPLWLKDLEPSSNLEPSSKWKAFVETLPVFTQMKGLEKGQGFLNAHSHPDAPSLPADLDALHSPEIRSDLLRKHREFLAAASPGQRHSSYLVWPLIQKASNLKALGKSGAGLLLLIKELMAQEKTPLLPHHSGMAAPDCCGLLNVLIVQLPDPDFDPQIQCQILELLKQALPAFPMPSGWSAVISKLIEGIEYLNASEDVDLQDMAMGIVIDALSSPNLCLPNVVSQMLKALPQWRPDPSRALQAAASYLSQDGRESWEEGPIRLVCQRILATSMPDDDAHNALRAAAEKAVASGRQGRGEHP